MFSLHCKTSESLPFAKIFYPQSNGKLERWRQSLKRESIRQRSPLSIEDARQIAGQYVQHHNTRSLHSAIGYVTPSDKLAGRELEILAARDGKLEAAGQERQGKRKAARAALALPKEKTNLTEPLAGAMMAPSRETEAGSAEEQPAEG